MKTTREGFLKEEEIRPRSLKRKQAKYMAADVRELLRQRSRFVKVPCPACNSTKFRKAFNKYGLTYLRCLECGTVSVNPRPTAEILEDFYAVSKNYEFWNKCMFPASEDARRKKIFQPRVNRMIELCRRRGIRHRVLLEVGAGFGTFCEEAVRSGFFQRVIAVEPNLDLASTCKDRGIEVIAKPIEQVGVINRPADIIVSFEVIEHLFSPANFIKNCVRLLAPGGILVLTCPNIQGFDVSILEEKSDSVDYEHLNYFNPISLARLLARNGFEVIELLTPGKLDAELVRDKVLSGEFSLNGQLFLKRILIDEWEKYGSSFQRFLADNNLSSSMWAVARKR